MLDRFQRSTFSSVLLLALGFAFAAPATGAAAAAGAQEGDAPALPLADQLPADAIIYAGWAGGDRVEELYEGTHTQALLQQSNFADLFERYLPELLDQLEVEDPDAAQPMAAVREMLPTLLKRPVAFAFGGIEFDPNAGPMPKVMFAIDAGGEADALEQRIRTMLDEAEQGQMGAFLTNENGILRFAMGFTPAELEGGADAGEAFRQAFADLNAEPVVAMLVDFPRLIAAAEEATAEMGGREQQQQVVDVIDKLGLRGLGTLGITSGFEGQMYETRGFLGISDREGVLRLIPDGPLDEQTLAAIPAGSTMVWADQFDLATAVEVLRSIIVEFEPRAEGEIEEIRGMVNEAAGADVEQDILKQFGTTWGAYVSPKIGSGVLSGVIVNRPEDAATLETALAEASGNILERVNQRVQEETDGEITLPGRTVEVDGQTLHVLSVPAFAPTWSIDREAELMRVGLFPQSILSARALEGDAFVDSDAWQTMREQLAPGDQVVSLRYYDLPELASDAYPLILIMTQLGVGFGDLYGEKLGTRPPVVVLPPLATMLEHVEPSAGVAWVTDEGLHFRNVEPFPLSNILTTDWQSFAAQQYSTMISILLPSLNRAREAANRIKSGSNLRWIGQAMRQAAIDDVRSGRYPADLETLFLNSDLPMEAFISPRTDTQLPEMMAQAREVQAQWVAQNSDFIYLGGAGMTDAAPSTIPVAYEDPEKVGDFEGVNVLYADGSVRFVTLPQLQEDLQRHVEYRQQRNLEIPPGLGV